MASSPRSFEQSEKHSPRFQGHSQRFQFPTPKPQNKTGVSPIQEVPKLPTFSGEDQKYDVTFDVWRYELKCLVRLS